MDNYKISTEEFMSSHSSKIDFEQPGARGKVTDLPKAPQLMKRTVKEYKVPKWV